MRGKHLTTFPASCVIRRACRKMADTLPESPPVISETDPFQSSLPFMSSLPSLPQTPRHPAPTPVFQAQQPALDTSPLRSRVNLGRHSRFSSEDDLALIREGAAANPHVAQNGKTAVGRRKHAFTGLCGAVEMRGCTAKPWRSDVQWTLCYFCRVALAMMDGLVEPTDVLVLLLQFFWLFRFRDCVTSHLYLVLQNSKYPSCNMTSWNLPEIYQNYFVTLYYYWRSLRLNRHE